MVNPIQMAKPKRQYRDIFIFTVLRIATVFGVSNHTFDRDRQQFVYSPGAFVYRVSLHIAAFIVIAINFSDVIGNLRALVREMEFIAELGFCCLSVNIVVVFLSLVSEWRYRAKSIRFFNELLMVRIEDSAGSENLRLHTWKLLFFKSISTILTVIMSALTAFLQLPGTAESILATASMLTVVLVLIAHQYQFSMAMLYGGYLFKALNLRLSQVVEEINDSLYLSRRKSQRLSEVLAEIGLLHTNLRKLVIRIKDIYQFDILLLLMTLLLFQVYALFNLFIAARGVLGEVSITVLICQTGSTFLSTIEMLVSHNICVECVEACDASGSILKSLTSFLVIGSCLDRDIDALSFQFAREKMRLTICGMFDLDANTAPDMFKGIIINFILLGQITYNELH